ncbi:MAG: hypothetical protein AB7S26_37255, partial [Sandaracinaceae bacterium]
MLVLVHVHVLVHLHVHADRDPNKPEGEKTWEDEKRQLLNKGIFIPVGAADDLLAFAPSRLPVIPPA